MLGDSIVPVLMQHLSSQDHRIVANTIEAFSEIRSKEIVKVLTPFLFHQNNRVKANTVMVLYKFKMVREICFQILEEMSKSSDPLMQVSFLYAIATIRDRKLYKLIANLADYNEPMIERNLAFALSEAKIERGIRLFAKILKDEEKSKDIIHHLVQLKLSTRFRVLEEFLEEATSTDILQLKNLLENSKFFFKEELDFISYNIAIEEDKKSSLKEAS